MGDRIPITVLIESFVVQMFPPLLSPRIRDQVPSSTLLPFSCRAPSSKLNTRNQGTLLMKGTLGNLVGSRNRTAVSFGPGSVETQVPT